MANNKIQLASGVVLLDLTADTVDAAHLADGYTAHDKSGAVITGTMSGGLSASDAVLFVTVTAGSTVTATKGGTTLSPTMWTTAADASLETAIFSVEPSLFDAQNAWTITATKTGIGTGSYTITISEAKSYFVELSFGYLIYRNGWQNGYLMETISGGYDPNGTYAIDNYADPPRATTTRGNWGFALNNTIDVTNYSTLYVEIAIDYPYNYRGLFGLWQPANANARKFYDSSGGGADVYYQKNSGIPRDVYTLDVSGLYGEYVFKAQQRDGSTATNNYGIYLYDMYLS